MLMKKQFLNEQIPFSLYRWVSELEWDVQF